MFAKNLIYFSVVSSLWSCQFGADSEVKLQTPAEPQVYTLNPPVQFLNSWDKPEVSVCWKDQDEVFGSFQDKVERAVTALFAGLFNLEGWTYCADVEAADVRIRTQETGQAYALPGKDQLLKNPQFNEPPFQNGEAMVLVSDTLSYMEGCADEDECLAFVSAHEFMHVIGFSHESDRIDWHEAPDYEKFAYGTLALEDSDGASQARHGKTFLGDYSHDSLTSYYFINKLKNGEHSKFKLGEVDRRRIHMIYNEPFGIIDHESLDPDLDGKIGPSKIKVRSPLQAKTKITHYRYKRIVSRNAKENYAKIRKVSGKILGILSDRAEISESDYSTVLDLNQQMKGIVNEYDGDCKVASDYGPKKPVSETTSDHFDGVPAGALVKLCILGGYIDPVSGKEVWQNSNLYSSASFFRLPPEGEL